MSQPESLSDTLARAVHEWALNRRIDGQSHLWPLSVRLGHNESDDWWGYGRSAPRRRKGVVASIHNNKGHICSVIQGSPKAKPTLYVEKGVNVVYVDQNGDADDDA